MAWVIFGIVISSLLLLLVALSLESLNIKDLMKK